MKDGLFLGGAAVLALCLTSVVSAQDATHSTNRAPKTFTTAAPRTGLQMTNEGILREATKGEHVLSSVTGAGAILYAPSEADDAALRAAISAAAGGAVVDYFDASAGTPDVALLSNYDCVFVWANFPFADSVGYGDNLAAYVDGGGVVVLGAFCTYTSGNSLGGLIMTSGYCPVVSPLGSNHFVSSPYIGDGVTCLYDGVASLDCVYRDILTLQGAGIQDGSYADGEICHAYRPDGRVVYSNGNGGFPITCGGDGAVCIANACSCLLPPGTLIDCACDAQYDVGDRVVLLVDNPDGNPDLFAGHKGTVICGGLGFPPLLVLWDDFSSGHDGNGFCECPSNGGGFSGGPIVLPDSSGWYVYCEDVAHHCPADINGNGAIDFGDLIEVLSNWGPCPQ